MSTNTELPKVNILLAVYNGEKHLKKQLDSLCAQTYDNIDIYIRDDGSTDDSVAFIKKYMGNNESNKNIFFAFLMMQRENQFRLLKMKTQL